MKKYILIILILLSPLPVFLQADNLTSPFNSIVPRPAQITPGSGSFIFSAKTTFAVENQEQATIAHNFIEQGGASPFRDRFFFKNWSVSVKGYAGTDTY